MQCNTNNCHAINISILESTFVSNFANFSCHVMLALIQLDN